MTPTPAMLAAAYDLLAECPPFTRWNMPPSEDVEFVVDRDRKTFGRCTVDLPKRPQIRISAVNVTTLDTLSATMAHEMIHLHMDASGMKDSAEHGRGFRKLALRVCAALGFNPDTF